MEKHYLVIVEHTDTGFAAYVPDLPTILVTAATQDELKQLVGEAIYLYHEEMQELGQPIPEPISTAEYLPYQNAV